MENAQPPASKTSLRRLEKNLNRRLSAYEARMCDELDALERGVRRALWGSVAALVLFLVLTSVLTSVLV